MNLILYYFVTYSLPKIVKPFLPSTLFSILLLTFVAVSCNQDSDPDPTAPKSNEARLELIRGQDQAGATGQLLRDTLLIKFVIENADLKPASFIVFPKLASGHGIATQPGMDQPAQFIPVDGKDIRLIWRLGCGDAKQKMTIYLYNTDSCGLSSIQNGRCQPVDSVVVNATASTPHGWNRACGFSWTDRYNTKIRQRNGQLHAINQGELHKLVIKAGYDWVKIPGAPTEIYDFGFTSTGTLYVLTRNKGLYRTADFSTWLPVSSGIQDPREAYGLMVEDTVVYASFYFDGLYRLRPQKSNSWQRTVIQDQSSEEYRLITRHPNGDLYLIDKWDAVWHSSPGGSSWTRIPLSYRYLNYEAEDIKIHDDGKLYIGSGDASLAIVDVGSYEGEVHKYYEWNATHQFINNIRFKDGNVYYLVNFTPNPGVYSSSRSWSKIDLGFDKTILEFEFDPSGNFILVSYDGSYYWKD